MDGERHSIALVQILSNWAEAKWFAEHATAFSADALHVIAGVVILLLAAVVLQKPVSSWLPWLAVFVLTVVNETGDLWLDRWPNPSIQYGEGLKDVLLTMLLPTLLLVSVRFWPSLFMHGGDPQRGNPTE